MVVSLLIGATFAGGILAGVSLQKAAVELPAFRHLGVQAWADYGRHADLGPGLVLYPVLAIGTALLTIGAVLAARRNGLLRGHHATVLYAAALFALGGLLATIKAAPNMLQAGHAGLSDSELQVLYERFTFWHAVRTIDDTLAFAAIAWALCVVVAVPEISAATSDRRP
jgi:hypothetical protein